MDICDIDGMLYKWTNYWGGWQPRWFVLDNGILAYYSCLEEVNQGCKASLNVSAGEVRVHPNDNTRFDIILQHDQHWYLRASTPTERQKWLIVLGTVKARKTELTTIKEKESIEATCEIQTKVSELRLYCDLLQNQVTQLRQEAQNGTPDTLKLTETSSMLVATCDTFLNTLTQCLSMAENKFVTQPHGRRSPHDNAPMALTHAGIHKTRHKERHNLRSVSVDESSTMREKRRNSNKSTDSFGPDLPASYSVPTSPQIDINNSKSSPLGDTTETLMQLKLTNTPIRQKSKTSVNSNHEKTGEVQKSKPDHGDNIMGSEAINNNNPPEISLKPSSVSETSDETEERHLTFFSAMLNSFTDIMLEEDGGIPTTPFLSACDGMLPFFDAIGSTAFAPVKMDLAGNIKKLRTKQLTDPARFCTLQGIVKREIDTNTTKVRASATDALLWLKRGLRFMQHFLTALKNGEKDLTASLNGAYNMTLKKYHSWVVRGIFALAVKAAPYYDDFIKVLATDSLPSEHPKFLGTLLQDIDQYVTAMEVVLTMLDNFYQQYLLDSDAVV